MRITFDDRCICISFENRMNFNASVKFIEKSLPFSGSLSQSLSHFRTIGMDLRYRTLFTVQEGESMPLDFSSFSAKLSFVLSGNESVGTRHRLLTSSGPEQRQQIQINFKRKIIFKFEQLFSIYSISFSENQKRIYFFTLI